MEKVPAGSWESSAGWCDGHHITNSQVWCQSTLEAGKKGGGGGEFYSWNLCRFLKPQSEEGELQLSRHQERQRKQTFVPLTTLRPRVARVGSDYGFKNPAQVHLEYKDIFS